MHLCVIGPGVVGRATGEGWHRFGHSVTYVDKGGTPPVDADLYFICTPEDIVPEVVQELVKRLHSGQQVVIRSSVSPGTTQALADRYPDIHFWHNPEFLREAVAEQDFLHATRAIIGHPHPFWNSGALDNLYGAMQVPVHHCDSTVSELAKLVTNAYLALIISFWNEQLGMFRSLDVNGHMVARLVALDPRVSHYGAYQFGQPYGGSCLPKDVQQLLDLKKRPDLSPWPMPILEAVRAVNRALGGT